MTLGRRAQWLSQKILHRAQRLTVQVGIGFGLVLSSHFISPDPLERAWCRDTGTAIAGFGFARWLSEQGKRRMMPDGRPLRHPTIKIDAEDAERIRKALSVR